jgi:hypothetical protein
VPDRAARDRQAEFNASQCKAVFDDPLDLPTGWAAAVVADAIETHRVPERGVGVGQCLQNVVTQVR